MENAKKETLAGENDRKAASPTESAARGKLRRERSGADDPTCGSLSVCGWEAGGYAAAIG